MSDQTKPSDVKGMLKHDTPLSIEVMNDAIREQCVAALIGPGDCDRVLGDSKARSETLSSIADKLNDSEGNNIEYDPPKLDIQVRPFKE